MTITVLIHSHSFWFEQFNQFKLIIQCYFVCDNNKTTTCDLHKTGTSGMNVDLLDISVALLRPATTPSILLVVTKGY